MSRLPECNLTYSHICGTSITAMGMPHEPARQQVGAGRRGLGGTGSVRAIKPTSASAFWNTRSCGASHACRAGSGARNAADKRERVATHWTLFRPHDWRPRHLRHTLSLSYRGVSPRTQPLSYSNVKTGLRGEFYRPRKAARGPTRRMPLSRALDLWRSAYHPCNGTKLMRFFWNDHSSAVTPACCNARP